LSVQARTSIRNIPSSHTATALLSHCLCFAHSGGPAFMVAHIRVLPNNNQVVGNTPHHGSHHDSCWAFYNKPQWNRYYYVAHTHCLVTPLLLFRRVVVGRLLRWRTYGWCCPTTRTEELETPLQWAAGPPIVRCNLEMNFLNHGEEAVKNDVPSIQNDERGPYSHGPNLEGTSP
jgi:hypothetical protein